MATTSMVALFTCAARVAATPRPSRHSLVSGHRFPRDVILLAVRYYLQLGAAAERIAGILADRGIDVSGRTILRWVQKFGPALSEEIRRYRKPLSRTWLVVHQLDDVLATGCGNSPTSRAGWGWRLQGVGNCLLERQRLALGPRRRPNLLV